ncbi:unnamed protein product [Acanthoscelides obtectus]|uniref:Uncharacterized protein n=1 Tax=Acanthoscelides obtectus TaxID=200917 RepID=A0A9P0L804_ACAOB|nr:unnamed protein product [Acanthoscelides obtectus]CAK1649703.1 hypothetical protein AOBTE_LOCUS16364 [Acanthoscelides obtectus]
MPLLEFSILLPRYKGGSAVSVDCLLFL